jgi:nitrate/TMAO reductase-like tetraheme cytochrome c subunit
MTDNLSPFGIAALASSAIAAVILIQFLVRRPALTAKVRVQLLFGLGVFPLAAAGTSTAFGLHRTTERTFCGSCHVMTRHQQDAEDPASGSLAARHARNAFTGGSNCYVCHSDYGSLGYPLTKLNGMNHVYQYYLRGYREMPLEKALKEIRVAKPYPNSNCMQCHSGKLDSFQTVREHRALETDLLANKVACASAGCHGYSHPFNKDQPGEEQAHK